jgi:hypothetical protein
MLTVDFSNDFSAIEKRVYLLAAQAAYDTLRIEKPATLRFEIKALPGTAMGCVQKSSDDPPEVFIILLDACNMPYQNCFAIGHEMIHVRQYLYGDLMMPEDDSTELLWKGKPYLSVRGDQDGAAYLALPWEAEAAEIHVGVYRDICKAIPPEERRALDTERSVIIEVLFGSPAELLKKLLG